MPPPIEWADQQQKQQQQRAAIQHSGGDSSGGGLSESDHSPPTKASLLKWWKTFTNKHSANEHAASTSSAASYGSSSKPGARRATVSAHPYQLPKRGLAPGQDSTGRVFGVSLEQSLRYASVAISMVGEKGDTNVYGYIPIVVAKCGMFLKEIAINTEGIFRVSGSNKRINELQVLFDTPPRYGKDLSWEGYTVHDAASVLRRYLNMLPDPVIPANLYLDFIAVLKKDQDTAASIQDFRKLISLLPPTSRYLLLYLLDFLSMFARASGSNLMTASNLAVVFQPGLVATREAATAEGALLGYPGFHGNKPGVGSNIAAAKQGAGEHGKGKEVLEFLIEQQSHFVIGLEKPIKTIEKKGAATSTSSTSKQPVELGLAIENATDLTRRGSERSVERRRLRKSGTDGKVKRSKTLPSRRSNDHTPRESPSESPRIENAVLFGSTPASSGRPSSALKADDDRGDASKSKRTTTKPSSSPSTDAAMLSSSPGSQSMARTESSKSGNAHIVPKWLAPKHPPTT